MSSSLPAPAVSFAADFAAWYALAGNRPPSSQWVGLLEFELAGNRFTIAYNRGTGKIYRVQTGSAVLPLRDAVAAFFAVPSPADLDVARRAWAGTYSKRIIEQDTRETVHPEPGCFPGFDPVPVKFLEATSLRGRTYQVRGCPKCGTTGTYTDPNGKEGRCYPCRGFGREEQFGKLADEHGNKIEHSIAAGAVGVAVRPAELSFEAQKAITSENRGAPVNSPEFRAYLESCMTRANSRVLVKLEAGGFVLAPLTALTLVREPLTREQAVSAAEEIAVTLGAGDDRWRRAFAP